MIRARTALAALTLALASPCLADQASSWVHVRVTDGAGEETAALNLPLSLAEAAFDLAGQSRVDVQVKESLPEGMTLADLRRTWAELRDAGDVELASLREGDSTVKLAREGDHLVVTVDEVLASDQDGDGDGDGEPRRTKVRLPVQLVDALLGGEGESLDVRAAIRELRNLGAVDVLNVEGARETVRIWVD